MNPTISLAGDSQAQGLLAAGLPARVTGARWIAKLSRAGANSEGVRVLVQQALAAGVPDMFVVVAGGGDVHLPEGRALRAWRAIIADLANAGVQQVVWVGPPAAMGDEALDAQRLNVSRAQRSVMLGLPGVEWLDGRELTTGLPYRDRVHLTSNGYRTYAERLARPLASTMPLAREAAAPWGLRLVLTAGIVAGGWLIYTSAQGATAGKRRTR